MRMESHRLLDRGTQKCQRCSPVTISIARKALCIEFWRQIFTKLKMVDSTMSMVGQMGFYFRF